MKLGTVVPLNNIVWLVGFKPSEQQMPLLLKVCQDWVVCSEPTTFMEAARMGKRVIFSTDTYNIHLWNDYIQTLSTHIKITAGGQEATPYDQLMNQVTTRKLAQVATKIPNLYQILAHDLDKAVFGRKKGPLKFFHKAPVSRRRVTKKKAQGRKKQKPRQRKNR